MYSKIALLVVAVSLGSTADAAVLCAKRTGSVRLREVCKPKERPVDGSVLGLLTEGTQGPQGPAGAAGPKGDAGPQGVAGPQGAPGAQGAVGPTGEPGPQGAPGAQGSPGAQGAQGAPGAQGFPGAQGVQGIQGIQGLQGKPGETGPRGPSNGYAKWVRGALTLPYSSIVSLGTLDLPAGVYLVTGKTNVTMIIGQTLSVDCALTSAGQVIDKGALTTTTSSPSGATVVLHGITKLASSGTIGFNCLNNSNGTITSADEVQIQAIAVEQISSSVVVR